MSNQTKLTIMVDKDVVEWGKRQRAKKGFKRQDDYWNDRMHELKRAGEFTQELRGEAIKHIITERGLSK